VSGVLLEKRLTDSIRDQDALERTIVYRACCQRRPRCHPGTHGSPLATAQVFEEAARPIDQGLELHPDLVS
jgi:hypothetical protein